VCSIAAFVICIRHYVAAAGSPLGTLGRLPHIHNGATCTSRQPAAVTFTENGDVDVAQLNALYGLIGWDRERRRTTAESIEMLRVSHYYIAAHTANGALMGA
jgi:hypothetical protein